MTTRDKKHKRSTLAADVLREKNTAAMYRRVGDEARALEHEARYKALAAKQRQKPPARLSRLREQLVPRFFLLCDGFLDGQMVMQEIPLTPEVVLVLEEHIGGEHAYGAPSGTVLRDLVALRRKLSDPEEDLVADGLHRLTEAADKALAEPRLRLVPNENEEAPVAAVAE